MDDCAYSKRLSQTLRGAPFAYDVETSTDVGLLGASDAEQFAHTQVQQRVLVTKTPSNFEALHQRHPNHQGVLAICQDNDARDMSDADLARAIRNLVEANVSVANTFHVLNHWRY